MRSLNIKPRETTALLDIRQEARNHAVVYRGEEMPTPTDRRGRSICSFFKRRPKFYRLTAAGRKQLERELETWDRLSAAIALVLGRAAEVSS